MIVPLSDDDHKKVDEWIKGNHLRCANKYHGAIGGFLEYWAVPTSVGTAYGVRCLICKEKELNLTDYDSW